MWYSYSNRKCGLIKFNLALIILEVDILIPHQTLKGKAIKCLILAVTIVDVSSFVNRAIELIDKCLDEIFLIIFN